MEYIKSQLSGIVLGASIALVLCMVLYVWSLHSAVRQLESAVELQKTTIDNHQNALTQIVNIINSATQKQP